MEIDESILPTSDYITKSYKDKDYIILSLYIYKDYITKLLQRQYGTDTKTKIQLNRIGQKPQK